MYFNKFILCSAPEFKLYLRLFWKKNWKNYDFLKAERWSRKFPNYTSDVLVASWKARPLNEDRDRVANKRLLQV